jgi:ATP-dependent DNA ligase
MVGFPHPFNAQAPKSHYLGRAPVSVRVVVGQNHCVLLSELVEASADVAATSSRSAKIGRIAALLRDAPAGEVTVAVAFLSGELLQGQIGVGYAALGEMFRAADAVRRGAGDPGAGSGTGGALTLTDTNAAFEEIGAVTGPGSQAERRRLLTRLFARASEREREFLVRLLAGDLGQGALEGIMTDAVARAAEVPADEVRRAHQLGGWLPEVASAALGGAQPAGIAAEPAVEAMHPAGATARPADGVAGAPVDAPHLPAGAAEPTDEATEPADKATEPADDTTRPTDDTTRPADKATEPADNTTRPTDDTTRPAKEATEPADDAGRSPEQSLAALRAFRLRVGRPARPMLAAAAPDVAAALDRISPAAEEWKIDGIRVQVHRAADRVAVFTRTLDDITARVPEIAEAAASLPVAAAVLDGEAVALAPDGRPRPFQITAARTASQGDVGRLRAQTPLTLFLFDLLHLNGTDLIDAPAHERHRLLAEVVPAALLTPRIVTADLVEAEGFFADAIAHGHEGVVVKSLDSPYRAGRRGGEWIKVKPRHTLDLVILAAEWGHGRRRGVLSNLHLGARDPETGGLVMLGKTFKGLTDEMLAWQTTRLLDLADPAAAQPEGEDRRNAHGVVWVRPELVVEIAFDGVQASRRYPGGLALRFARVLRFRPDKNPGEADTIDAVRAIWSGQAEP